MKLKKDHLQKKNYQHLLRALSRLLDYPSEALLEHRAEIAAILQQEFVENADNKNTPEWQDAKLRLNQFFVWLATNDIYALQEHYLACFDHSCLASLHLFEHVHGDSRDRGQAMVDLLSTYEQSGFMLSVRELPDHVAVLLEFASTQSENTAQELIAEVAHIMNRIYAALCERQSPYAAILATAILWSGEILQPIDLLAVPHKQKNQAAWANELSANWQEPPAFDGCSLISQAAPHMSEPQQPIHFYKPEAMPVTLKKLAGGVRS